MSKTEITSWEYAGIKTCIDVYCTVCETAGVVYDVFEAYQCHNCNWKPSVSRYHVPEFTQQLCFHAAMCEEIPHRTAADIEADNIPYGDGYGGD